MSEQGRAVTWFAKQPNVDCRVCYCRKQYRIDWILNEYEHKKNKNMKKVSCVILITMISMTSIFSQQTVTLSFTGRDVTNHYVQLHHVCITNLTKGWQETVYWPDTTLTMQNGTGTNEFVTYGGFSLSQNNPNPFDGTTDVNLIVEQAGAVTMEIADVNGRASVKTQNYASLQPGIHQFRISLSASGVYVMTARQKGQASSIKMVCNNGSMTNTIEYLGMVQTITYVLKSSTTNPFTFGDQMEYVGYATINGEEVESQRITQAQGASQTFTLQFPIELERLPSVTTNVITEIMAIPIPGGGCATEEFSALGGGCITDEGTSAVVEKGVCWSTSHNPTVTDSHTTEGAGAGSFTSSLTGLLPNNTYYVRAYATNSTGTSYGTEESLATTGQIPCVTIAGIYDYFSTCIEFSGHISSEGSSPVSERGVCWSTSHNPTVADNHISCGSGSGYYNYFITGLAPHTTYYLSAYAINDIGISYSEEEMVVTESNPTPVFGNISSAVIDETTIQISCNGFTWAGCEDSIVDKGVCWNTTDYYDPCDLTLANNHISEGSGNGSFSVNVTNLTPNIYYCFAVYATTMSGETVYAYAPKSRILLNLPTVSTTTVSGITDTSSVCGGNVTNDGSYQFDVTITARGVCWSTSPNPTISDNHTSDGTGTGSFTSNLMGLTPNTQYFVRAYATNSMGTAYGNEVSFTTISVASLPTVTTAVVTNITSQAAICGGSVISDGGAAIISRGVCWNTSPNPITVDSHTEDGTGVGSFISNLTNLTANTTYYIRAYATNNVGVAYGNEIVFTTPTVPLTNPCVGTATVSDYDGNIYNTVQIGDQCWMKENLRTTHYSNGGSLALGNDTSTTTAYRYYPNNNSENVVEYGYLYNWRAVMNNSPSCNNNPSGVQGICPNGWHVPSYSEWEELSNYVSSQNDFQCGSDASYIAKALAAVSGWNSNTNTCAVGNVPTDNNATGFSALPAGGFRHDGNYYNFGQEASFWSTTSATDFNPNAWDVVAAHYLRNYSAEIEMNYYYKYYSFSVRCLRNENSTVTLPTVTTNPVDNISEISAVCGGNVTFDGGATVTARGVCWSTSHNPTIANNHTSDGNGIGIYTSNIIGLIPNTTYYIRAYATNSIGTTYGNEVSFTTLSVVSLPIVTTTTVTNITEHSASSGGNVISEGGATVITRGICWNTYPNPTIANSHTEDGTGVGSYTSSLTNLTANTTYYVRAYATNSAGIAYGDELSFTTSANPQTQSCPGTTTVTDYDGNTYNTVQIGNQCWMKENLRTTHYSDGTLIPLGFSVPPSSAKYRNYPNDDSSTVTTYGYLYNWYAAMNGSAQSNLNPSGVQGACPVGWHIPSKSEWEQLLGYVQSQPQYFCQNDSNNIAKALASTEGWSDCSDFPSCMPFNQCYNNNATGFSALPAGWGAYDTETDETSFWYVYLAGNCGIRSFYLSSTTYSGIMVVGITLWSSLPNVVIDSGLQKCFLYSVRCLRD